jgi:outer membrane protein insertion porin family
MMSLLRFVSLFMVFFAVACTNGRGLPEGQVLYRGAKVKVVADDKKWNLGALKSEAESVVGIPAPNKSFLGLSPALWIYLHTKEDSWLQRKMGKAPVVLKNDMPVTTELLLGNRASNNGFFKIEVESKRIDRPLKRTAKMRYEVRVKAPAFLIDSVAFPDVSGPVETRIRATQNKTLLKKGEPYNLEKIKQERVRITTALQKEGYYYFKPDYLSIKADTLARSGRVNLKLVVKPSASERSKTAQTINNITFLAQTDTIGKEQKGAPGTHECITFGQMTGHKLSRGLLQKSMCMRCSRAYNPDEHDATLAYLSHLNTYKFINVSFVPSPLADSLMDVRVLLTPFARNKTKINLSGVFSPNLYWGAEFKGYVDHRNTFGHGELLRWSFSGEALRLPKQDEESNDVNLFPLETGFTLLIPRFRPPRVRRGKYFAPLVQSKLALNYQMTRFVILPRDLIEEKLGVTLHEFEFEGGLVLKNSRRPTITQEFNFIHHSASFLP